MQIVVTGASGFVGTAVCAALQAAGDTVIRLVRTEPKGPGEVRWDPRSNTLDHAALQGLGPMDAAIHLAGENVGGGRWTPERKALILDSRRQGTELLARELARLEPRPSVLLSASAIGYYGYRGEETLDDDSSLGSGFLAEVCRDWEAAADPAREAGIRVVHPRLGVVLDPHGGPLVKMLLPFRLGVGGPLGGGAQWMSWISLADTVGALRHALATPTLAGPVNYVSPNPVRNRELAAALGRVLHRPAFLPAPAPILRLLLGEMAEMALEGARVIPQRLLASGYTFRHPDLEPALQEMLNG
jgi:uncharacterized protein (TIGR01777 family)